jgi:hypothetical protein
MFVLEVLLFAHSYILLSIVHLMNSKRPVASTASAQLGKYCFSSHDCVPPVPVPVTWMKTNGKCCHLPSNTLYPAVDPVTAHSWSYIFEGDRFLVFASSMTISNPDSVSSSSKTEINPGIRNWKKKVSEWARWQEEICGVYFTKKWSAETLRSGLLEFDIFKPRLEGGISKRISWLSGSLLGGDDDRGFLQEGIKVNLMMAPMSFFNGKFLSLPYSQSHLYFNLIFTMYLLYRRRGKK